VGRGHHQPNVPAKKNVPVLTMDEETRRILERQQYRIVGDHSAVKICHWMRQKLLCGRPCYKELFYGISSHRCLQFTPTLSQCNHNCLFCWRHQNYDEHVSFTEDDPRDILDKGILAQRELISGFKGDERCDASLWKEAQEPNQVAISLAGEPTFYRHLGEFIELCSKRKMRTFLVTNGTLPGVLEELDPLPDQLYVTVAAPTEDIYKKLCAPSIRHGWSQLLKTLCLLPSLDTRTVIRHTLVKGWNISHIRDYARLDKIAKPMFIEPKAYVFVGSSRLRMSLANMPSFDEIHGFSRELAGETGYLLNGFQKSSRVCLLSREKKYKRFG